MIDLTFRCFSRARWITVATSRGIYDAQGNVAKGFDVDEIGAPIITMPSTIDTWFWVNLRFYGASETADGDVLYAGEIEDGFRFTKSKLAAFVRNQATVVFITVDGQSVKTYEFGLTTNRIQLLDPRSYAALRRREWLGGMSF